MGLSMELRGAGGCGAEREELGVAGDCGAQHRAWRAQGGVGLTPRDGQGAEGVTEVGWV